MVWESSHAIAHFTDIFFSFLPPCLAAATRANTVGTINVFVHKCRFLAHSETSQLGVAHPAPQNYACLSD